LRSPNPPESFALLRHVRLLSTLGEQQLATIAPLVRRKSVPKNRAVFSEGESTNTLYIILSGRVKIQRADADGKEVILAVLGSGEYFGEMSVIDDMPHSATVMTLENCELLTLSKEDFRAVMVNHSEIAMVVMRGLVQRLRQADSKIESLALLDVYGRVARVLVEFSEMDNGQRVVRGKLPRQDLAKMVGASREMVSRVMRDLENDGFIVVCPDNSLVLNEERGPRV